MHQGWWKLILLNKHIFSILLGGVVWIGWKCIMTFWIGGVRNQLSLCIQYAMVCWYPFIYSNVIYKDCSHALRLNIVLWMWLIVEQHALNVMNISMLVVIYPTNHVCGSMHFQSISIQGHSQGAKQRRQRGSERQKSSSEIQGEAQQFGGLGTVPQKLKHFGCTLAKSFPAT